ncbi:hypothetical protein M422DRAFT_777899 [Sphaerobolus stellatus SS14]|uniref:Uncharacterized protein n=1 Tax=Sphaerobolus stellatus (strain SS14) TaxID=990650 RepID=A0A0C9W4S2_SPHS4|nr:hypothetical protein M422DRAFT_777899 [Sphaerobolus stellatus SS14]
MAVSDADVLKLNVSLNHPGVTPLKHARIIPTVPNVLIGAHAIPAAPLVPRDRERATPDPMSVVKAVISRRPLLRLIDGRENVNVVVELAILGGKTRHRSYAELRVSRVYISTRQSIHGAVRPSCALSIRTNSNNDERAPNKPYRDPVGCGIVCFRGCMWVRKVSNDLRSNFVKTSRIARYTEGRGERRKLHQARDTIKGEKESGHAKKGRGPDTGPQGTRAQASGRAEADKNAERRVGKRKKCHAETAESRLASGFLDSGEEPWEGSTGEWDGGESLSFSVNLAAGEPTRLRTPVAANHTPPAQP